MPKDQQTNKWKDLEVRWDRLLGLFIEELATREVKTFSFITLTFNSTMEKPTTELANRIVVLCDFFTTKNICVLGSVEYAAKLHLHLLVSRWLTTKEQKTLEDRWAAQEGYGRYSSYSVNVNNSLAFTQSTLTEVRSQLLKTVYYLTKSYRLPFISTETTYEDFFKHMLCLRYSAHPQKPFFGAGVLKPNDVSFYKLALRLNRLVDASLLLYHDCPVPPSYYDEDPLTTTTTFVRELYSHWAAEERKLATKKRKALFEAFDTYVKASERERTDAELQVLIEQCSYAESSREFTPRAILRINKPVLKQAQALFNDNFPAILQAQLATVKGACMKSLFELFASRCASPEFFCYVLDSMLDILLREQSTKKPATGDKDTTVQFLESALRGSLTSRLKHAYFAYPQSSEASVQLMGQHLKFLQEAVECLSDAPQKLEALKAKLVYSITDIERLLALRKAKASKRKKKQFPEGADALEEPAEPAKKPAEEENRYLWLKDVNFLSFTALLADAILQTLYGIEFLELSTKACLVTAQTYNNVHFCRLPQSVYETLMEERLRYRILLPFVQPPQPFRTAGPGRIAGGYCTTGRREVLFNFQPFLKSFVGHSFLSTVNKLQQRNAFAINTTFLYYLMDLTVQQLGDCTELGLAFQEYVRRRITKSSTRQAGSATIDLLPVFEYLSTMFLAELYSRRSNLGFYFLYFLDRRCRLYLRAYPLSFFATRHLRPLFVQAHTSSPALSFEARARLFEQEVLGFFSRSEWAAKAGFLLDPSRSLAGLDASSQLYQLLGGLLGDRRLLTLTYVLPLEELVIGPRTADESLGLYEYLLLKFKEHLDSSGGSALLEKELRGLQQIIDASSDRSELHLNPADWGVDALLEKADRPWVKSTLMTYGYNKSTLEIIKDSFSHFFPEPEIRKNLNYWRVANQAVVLLVKELLRTFEREFQALSTLRQLFRQVSSLAGLLLAPIYVTFATPGAFPEGFAQFYYEEPVIKVQRYVPAAKSKSKEPVAESKSKSKKPVAESKSKSKKPAAESKSKEPAAESKPAKARNITQRFVIPPAPGDTLVWDRTKNEKALLPNTIHQLDALILSRTVENLAAKDIFVQPVHDCFYVPIEKASVAREAYKEAYVSLFHQDLLGLFLLNLLSQWLLEDGFPEVSDQGVVSSTEPMPARSPAFRTAWEAAGWPSLKTISDLDAIQSIPDSVKDEATKKILSKVLAILKIYRGLRKPPEVRQEMFNKITERPANPRLLSY